MAGGRERGGGVVLGSKIALWQEEGKGGVGGGGVLHSKIKYTLKIYCLVGNIKMIW